MNIVIFDTETTNLQKPFCYNVGYVIVDTEEWETLIEREYVVEQVWHNRPLFESAYYAEKRPIYVNRMRSRRITMEKWGYITQQMIRDFREYHVEGAYAYNSPFDNKVFDFCCDWFKTKNPFDTVPIFDIRGYVQEFLVNDAYREFCEENQRFTENGNYSSTAETVFQYITGRTEFEEEHTALSDSLIEVQILKRCMESGGELATVYPVKYLTREIEKVLSIGYRGEEFTEYRYRKKFERNGKITLIR